MIPDWIMIKSVRNIGTEMPRLTVSHATSKDNSFEYLSLE